MRYRYRVIHTIERQDLLDGYYEEQKDFADLYEAREFFQLCVNEPGTIQVVLRSEMVWDARR